VERVGKTGKCRHVRSASLGPSRLPAGVCAPRLASTERTRASGTEQVPSDIVFGMKPILLEIVNRLSEMGARVGALEAALVHTRQLTTGDIERLLGAHKANIESQLATLRASIAALPE
jgi:hypothetical protein